MLIKYILGAMYREYSLLPRDTGQILKRKKGSKIKYFLWQAKCWIVVEKWTPTPQIPGPGRKEDQGMVVGHILGLKI